MSNWYSQKIPHLLHEFKADLERGLSSDEAATQRSKYGSNEILQPHERSLFALLLKQFANLTVIPPAHCYLPAFLPTTHDSRNLSVFSHSLLSCSVAIHSGGTRILSDAVYQNPFRGQCVCYS